MLTPETDAIITRERHPDESYSATIDRLVQERTMPRTMTAQEALWAALQLHNMEVAPKHSLPYTPYATTAHVATPAEVRASDLDPDGGPKGIWIHIPDVDGVRLYWVGTEGAGALLMRDPKPACSCKRDRNGRLRAWRWHSEPRMVDDPLLTEVAG